MTRERIKDVRGRVVDICGGKDFVADCTCGELMRPVWCTAFVAKQPCQHGKTRSHLFFACNCGRWAFEKS